jgi:hypothetical protein
LSGAPSAVSGPALNPSARRALWKFLIPVAALVVIGMAAGLFWLKHSGEPNSASTTTLGPLEIVTIPAGAHILIDSQQQGLSNLKVDIPLGSHHLTASLEGYQTVTRQFEILPGGSPLSLNLALMPLNNTPAENAITSGLPAVTNATANPKGPPLPAFPAAPRQAGKAKTTVVSAAPQPLVPIQTEAPIKVLTGGLAVHSVPQAAQITLQAEGGGVPHQHHRKGSRLARKEILAHP